jgi:hypothetical protein
MRTVVAYLVHVGVVFRSKESFQFGITHGGSSGGGGASLTISTRRPGTPIVAIWYESSPVSYGFIRSRCRTKRAKYIDIVSRDKALQGMMSGVYEAV